MTSKSHLASDFIGRQPEMAVLTSALDGALLGQGCTVMLAGEPGIGKTRTVQELASYAKERSAQVHLGWCDESQGAPPYWPWVQIIRSYVQQCDAGQLQFEMGLGATNIADIVPEIKIKIKGLKSSPALEPEAARFRLFDSITSFLKNASQSQPLMLVLDDIHWADTPSLLLFQYLARELAPSQSGRLLLVGCYRDEGLSRRHPLSETLAQLIRSTGNRFQHVLLRGFDREDTARFIESVGHVEPTNGLVEALFSHTEGNPFFMTEAIRLLSESGELTSGHSGPPERLRIPEHVREVIGQRLNRVSERCNDVLTIASIIGREFDFRLLRILLGEFSEEQLLQAVDEAVSYHLIEDVLGQPDNYQFSHALIQQTLADEMTTSRKVRLHSRVGEALEELYGGEAEVHAAELAHHFAEAQTSIGPDKLVRYSIVAGEQALAAYAWEEAQAHFERGLSGTDNAQITDQAAALLFGLGQAQVGLLQIEEAVVNLRRTFDYFSRSGNVDQAVAVACFSLPYVTARLEGVTQMVADALELVRPNSRQAALLLSRYGVLLHSQYGNYAGAEKAFIDALEIAKKEKDGGLELRTLTEAAFVDVYAARWDEALVKSLSALELAKNLSDPRSEVIARYCAGISLIVNGDLAGARRQFEAGLPVSEKVGDRFWLSRLYRGNMLAYEIKGDWEGARSFSDRALEIWPDDTRALTARAKMEYELGDFAQGEHFLVKVLETLRVAPQGPSMDYCLAAICLAITDLIKGNSELSEHAKIAAESILSFSTGTSIVPHFANAALGILKAVLEGNSEAAREQYDARGSQRGFLLVNCGMVNDRYLGLLSQTMGNLDQAAVHFDGALSFCRMSGYRPELAWTCRDYSDMLLKRNREGDRARTMSLLEESIAIASELGMRPLMESVTVLQERAEAQPVQAPVYPDGLTQREVEVIELIAAGKTNREIAEDLVISVRTVANHVNSILFKTDSANRTEAAAYAARQRLVSW